jgi:hypothetical protein
MFQFVTFNVAVDGETMHKNKCKVWGKVCQCFVYIQTQFRNGYVLYAIMVPNFVFYQWKPKYRDTMYFANCTVP